MSEALTQRISAMKAKAEALGKMEDALMRVCECVREFREEVDRPLPSSPQLETCHGNTTEQQVMWRKYENFTLLLKMYKFCRLHCKTNARLSWRVWKTC